MRLADALRIQGGEAWALVGAGGKSSAMARLGRELGGEFLVLLTTTTRLAAEQSSLADRHLIVERRGQLEEQLAARGALLVTGPARGAEGKWTAPGEEVLARLRHLATEREAILLIEADGARGRSLKAPAEHEPVVPPWVDGVVVVAGLDALGEGLDSPRVHRPGRVQAVLGAVERVGPQEMARLLTAEAGGLKGVPHGAAVRLLLTHAGPAPCRQGGREVARLALREGRVRAVVLAELGQEDPALEVRSRVAGLVLAAGAGRRLAADKLLMPWRGEPLLAHALRAAHQAGLEPIIVVASERVAAARARLRFPGLRWVLNPHPERGQSSSLRLGLGALPEGAQAVVVLLGDMPLVTAELIRALVARHSVTLAPVVAPLAGARRGNPVLFDRVTFEDLARVEGDRGGRAIFPRFPPVFVPADERVLFDVDSEEDYRRLLGMGGGGRGS